MIDIYSETDESVCRELWEQLIPPEKITDLWDVRGCFHRYFKRDVFFVVAKIDGKLVGILPLSYIPEKDCYSYFPGETWKGKTWIEQNRIIAQDQNVFNQMLRWLDKENIKLNARYLSKEYLFDMSSAIEDEIGYIFHPELFGFNMERYYELFSRKSIKQIRKDINGLYEMDLTIRTGESVDFDLMVQMNLDRFSGYSYFADERFCQSFRDLRDYLLKKGWLKMTTIMIDNQVAAVDMGCVYNGIYTLLAGGTNSDYPCIAKVINMYHLEEACRQKYKEVDFLCGDFTWKKIFHLTPRPLYEISNMGRI